MRNVDHLIIGGGPAGAAAAETLRREGAVGPVALLSAEPWLPYWRPALSKSVLLEDNGAKTIFPHDAAFYDDMGVEVFLGCRAGGVDPARRLVETEFAGTFHYDRLLLATGSRARRLGAPGETLPGVLHLRNLDDAQAIAAAMRRSRSAVVIGSGFIALELAAAFVTFGIPTTVVSREAAPYPRLNAPAFSAFIADYFRAKGVTMIFGDTVIRIEGLTAAEGVITAQGRAIAGDLVAIGVGAEPETAFLEGSGVAIADGVLTNQRLETSQPGVFAAGDIANFFDPVFKRRRRLEHWDNAVKQGRIAARNMLGQARVHRTASYFFSDVFDLTFNTVGDVEGAGEQVVRGSPQAKSFSVLYLKDARLRGALLLERPLSEERAAGTLILNRIDLSAPPRPLGDERYPLEQTARQTVLILQGGGAMGAFEWGVVKALEEEGIFPDVVAGISIGAFNGAIIAANPRGASAALEAFWRELSVDAPDAPTEEMRLALAAGHSLMFGSPKFFRPRWLAALLEPDQLFSPWTSFCDPTPALELLRRHVDFPSLGQSPVRLLASAVDVETARLRIFDSYIDDLKPEHILASGSLPPYFPWTEIDGRRYWDGGLLSNSPLDLVVEHTSLSNKKVYAVNLYPGANRLPRNMVEVLARRDEILYCEKMAGSLRTRDAIESFHNLVKSIMATLPPEAADTIRQRPDYIESMGEASCVAITRIQHQSEPGELASRDFDFSRRTVERLMALGYEAAKAAIARENACRPG